MCKADVITTTEVWCPGSCRLRYRGSDVSVETLIATITLHINSHIFHWSIPTCLRHILTPLFPVYWFRLIPKRAEFQHLNKESPGSSSEKVTSINALSGLLDVKPHLRLQIIHVADPLSRRCRLKLGLD